MITITIVVLKCNQSYTTLMHVYYNTPPSQQGNYAVLDHSGIRPFAPIYAPPTTIYGEVDHVKTAEMGQQLNTRVSNF